MLDPDRYGTKAGCAIHRFSADHTHSNPHGDPHATLATGGMRALCVGIGGPVGSGKTALVAALCRTLSGELRLAVVTNDIYTTEDAANLDAVEDLEHRLGPLELVLMESGGDNLTATFSAA